MRLVWPLIFQRKLLLNAFITLQFLHAPIAWMFYSRKLNQERALRLVYKDCNSSFDELLVRDNYFMIHPRNLQKLPVEIFKEKVDIPPEFMKIIDR